MAERLQKLISASGLTSRRDAEAWILSGRVSVNGKIAALGDRADPLTDSILVDGKPLPTADQKVYIVLNKPRGYVTSLHDEKDRRTVKDLVEDLGTRVYPVGRLDLDSEGLLILTNDGDFANHLMHPSHEVEKTYRTWVRGDQIEDGVAALRHPMEIEGFPVCADRVELESLTENGARLRITIHEGRNRQVRKMCEQQGWRVTRLCRIREGAVSLKGLASGKWRPLTAGEIRSLWGNDGSKKHEE